MATPDGEKFEILRGTDVLDITDLTSTGLNNAVAVAAFEGLGMAPIQRFEQSGPAQHGATDIGYQLLPRNMRLSVLCEASTPTLFHTRRKRLLQMCKPSSTPLILRWTSADGAVRQIDCHCAGGLDLPFNDSARKGKWGFYDVMTLRAADPTWYDPAGYSQQFTMSYSSSGHVYPEVFPTPFGSTTVNTTINMLMDDPAAWDSPPVITATGLLTNLVITNLTTGKKLDFTGNSIASGAVWTIVTAYGQTAVTDGTGTNQISKLTNDSNIATFRLVEGDNSIQVTASVLDASAALLIQGKKRFIGR